MENGFKILIDRNPEYIWGVNIRIGLYRDSQLYVAMPIKFNFKPYIIGETVQPTLELSDRDGLPFLDALKAALENHHGIREGHIEGELKATKEHLNDMQKLVFEMPFRVPFNK